MARREKEHYDDGRKAKEALKHDGACAFRHGIETRLLRRGSRGSNEARRNGSRRDRDVRRASDWDCLENWWAAQWRGCEAKHHSQVKSECKWELFQVLKTTMPFLPVSVVAI